jgi:hypothetical protein
VTTSEYSPAHEAAFEAFTRSIQSEVGGDSYGYPVGATYLGADMEDVGAMLFESLKDGRDTILVSETGGEVLVRPAPINEILRRMLSLFDRVPVEVYFRGKPSPETPQALSDEAEVGIRMTLSGNSASLTPSLRHAFS